MTKYNENDFYNNEQNRRVSNQQFESSKNKDHPMI